MGPYSTAFTLTEETAFQFMEAIDDDMWIGDSGASSHLLGTDKRVYNKKRMTGHVNAANGSKMPILYEGKVAVELSPKEGEAS